MSGPDDQRLPPGFTVRLSRRTHRCDGGASLVGGSRGGALFLRPQARVLLGEDGRLRVGDDPRTATLARLLLDRGFADPCLDAETVGEALADEVTVVVPAHGRQGEVAALLGALPDGLPVVLVDDCSPDAAALARVAARRGARLVRHERNLGPAAARNTGLALARTRFIAFCDSDIVPEPGWLRRLCPHFDDPAVAAVAPRILAADPAPVPGRPGRGRSWTRRTVERYERARSSLDLGTEPDAVRPLGPVAYLPSACLVVRREALTGAGGFDPALRSGEDVDLVWRLVANGWRVRYEPAAAVRHRHRVDGREWLRRKVFYGTSAGPLGIRHGEAVAPMVLSGWTAVLTAALLAQRRWSLPVAVGVWAITTVAVGRRLAHSRRPLTAAAMLTGRGAVGALWQTTSMLTRHHWPLALAASVLSPRARRAVLVAALAEAVADRHRTHADLDLPSYLIAHRLDDLAYGAGLWWGVLRHPGHGALRALRPVVRLARPSPAAGAR